MQVQARAAEARAGEREDAADEPGGAAEGGDQSAGAGEGRLQTQVREADGVGYRERVP